MHRTLLRQISDFRRRLCAETQVPFLLTFGLMIGESIISKILWRLFKMCCHFCCNIHKTHSWREWIHNSLVFGANDLAGISLTKLVTIIHVTYLSIIKVQLCWYSNICSVWNHYAHDIYQVMPRDRCDLLTEKLWYSSICFVRKSITQYQILLPCHINKLRSNGRVLFFIGQSYPIMNYLWKTSLCLCL